jgi:hypothetical protein
MFLPTSRENVDALWENAYSISSSALNTWFGEELRPIGIDATYFHGSFFGGATVFRGNDTFGALPTGRGWRLGDHWALLGEHLLSNEEENAYASVSAETDGHVGWSARGGWRGEHFFVQATRIDNRSDALLHGELDNWRTHFNVAAVEYSNDVWTVAAESGWGPSLISVNGVSYIDDLTASYILVSRMFGSGRATLRAEEFLHEERKYAVTAAWLWTRRSLRPGVEVTTSDGDTRVLAEVRYHFSR